MNNEHPLDVYKEALRAYTPDEAFKRFVYWVEDFSYEVDILPWQEWLAHECRDEIEALCKRALVHSNSNTEKHHFWAGMGHWSRTLLFDKELTGKLPNAMDQIAGRTWCDFVRVQGKETALELTRFVATTHDALMLQEALSKPYWGIELAMHLDMFTDEALGSEQGLQGQTLGFWATRMAHGSRCQGWLDFCDKYPWYGPQLTYSILSETKSNLERAAFLSRWSQKHPIPAQALYAYTHSIQSSILNVTNFPQEMHQTKEELLLKGQLLNGLYAPATNIQIYMENYRELFGGIDPCASTQLPDLDMN